MARLIRKIAQQTEAITVTPVTFDGKNHKYPTDLYTNYGNIAWVTPEEAQRIIDVFGKAYILEGAAPGTFYVNPRFLEPEVETLIWRSRGAGQYEGDPYKTYG